MSFGRLLTMLLRHKAVGKHVVPIIPDEARTFGLDTLFREIGIYSPKGQLYEPVDKESFLYYNETKDGQILEEGITEAGSMSSFIAAGTAYATHGVNMIPFYIYYSMFGFQRIGDLMWLAGDIKAKGFLLGATYGRTTLNGEGLQHQDGHSLLTASTIPTLLTYDAAFGYEVATIIADGLHRMYEKGEDLFYYLTLYNEKYAMPAMPEGAAGGILKGLYKFKAAPEKGKHHAQIFGSGPIINEALAGADNSGGKIRRGGGCLERDELQMAAQRCPAGPALEHAASRRKRRRKSYLETLLEKEKGPFIAVSDNMKTVPDQIAPWVPGGLMTLGTDGYGRSDTRARICAASSKWMPNSPSSPRFMRWRKRARWKRRLSKRPSKT